MPIDSAAFPGNHVDALTIEYLRRYDLSETTPEQFCRMYWETWHRINAESYDAAKDAERKYLK